MSHGIYGNTVAATAKVSLSPSLIGEVSSLEEVRGGGRGRERERERETERERERERGIILILCYRPVLAS